MIKHKSDTSDNNYKLHISSSFNDAKHSGYNIENNNKLYEIIIF